MLTQGDRSARRRCGHHGERCRRHPPDAPGPRTFRSTAPTQVDGSGLGARATRRRARSCRRSSMREVPARPSPMDLPVAGQTGTLALRFLGTPVAGQLRAKTGTLNQVTALAGYVQTARGSHVSFAYIINLPPPKLITAADVALGDAARRHPLPVSGDARRQRRSDRSAADGAADVPARARCSFRACSCRCTCSSRAIAVLARHCMDGDREFGVVLIERGSEVGGNDVRTSVGTVAQIVDATELDDGRWVLGTVGTRRVRVSASGCPTTRIPRADVEDWDDDAVDGDLLPAYDAVRSLLATRARAQSRARRARRRRDDRAQRRSCARVVPGISGRAVGAGRPAAAAGRSGPERAPVEAHGAADARRRCSSVLVCTWGSRVSAGIRSLARTSMFA